MLENLSKTITPKNLKIDYINIGMIMVTLPKSG